MDSPKVPRKDTSEGEEFDDDDPFGPGANHFPQGSQGSQGSHGFQGSQRSTGVESKSGFDDPPSNLLNLSLSKYLVWAIKSTESESEDRYDPDEQWHSPMFAFTRLCRAHPDIADLSDVEAMKAVQKVLEKLPYRDPIETLEPWQRHFPLAGDADAIKLNFMTAWTAVRCVPFHDVLGSAAELAKKRTWNPTPDRGPLFTRFISLAGELQLSMKDRPIMLPTRRVAMLLGCSPRTVSSLRTLAIKDRLLVVTQPHSFRSSGKRMATEFHFAIERFNFGEKP
jgi:hypothetical protein